jgi:predicted nucleotidyltransferase
VTSTFSVNGSQPDSRNPIATSLQHTGPFTIAGMEQELSGLFGGREIDLRTYHDLSRYFRDEVEATALPLYAAA